MTNRHISLVMCIESCAIVVMVGGGDNCLMGVSEVQEEKQQRRTAGEGGTGAPNVADLR